MVLVSDLIASGRNGGHLRTFGAIQWVMIGRPKASCYPFNLDGHHFQRKNPQVQ